jgi:predicted aminopeptidase
VAVGEEYGEPLAPDDFAALANITFTKRKHNYMVIKTRQAGGSKFWDSINTPIEL